jgi:hypothetical protein
MSLGKSIVFAGSASRPPNQIGLKIVGDSSGSAAPIGLQIKGDSNRDPILFIDKTPK